MGTLSMTACKATAEAGCGKRPASKTKGWLGLGLGLLAIWLFVYGLAPWLQRHVESLAVLSEYIRRSGIDATAIYYTEVEEVGEADRAIRNTFRFSLSERDEQE